VSSKDRLAAGPGKLCDYLLEKCKRFNNLLGYCWSGFLTDQSDKECDGFYSFIMVFSEDVFIIEESDLSRSSPSKSDTHL
jgi:hypothetical protein